MSSEPRRDARHITTLREAARVFFSRPGPKLIAAKAGSAWLARAFAGPPRPSEIGVVAVVAAWWPFQEWLAHKHLLHWIPRELAGVRLDPGFARVHRAHHRDPRDIDLTLLPVEVVGFASILSSVLWRRAAADRRLALTGMASYATAALVYEWTHFLVHTGYVPKSGLYARIRRNHMNHHFLNENYWLGFTFPEVDRWMGTEPDPRSVSKSPTARKLHGLEQ